MPFSKQQKAQKEGRSTYYWEGKFMLTAVAHHCFVHFLTLFLCTTMELVHTFYK